MELAYKVFIQVIIMFILILLGFALTKFKIIDENGKSQFSEVLLTVVIPCVIINAFQVDFDKTLIKGLILAFICSILIHVVAILLGRIIYKNMPINNFSIIYANSGFMAIPLLQAVLGSEGVFYGAAYLAVFNTLVWTHGMYLFTKGNFTAKKLLLNHGLIGVVLGLSLFVTQIKLPFILLESIQYMASLNTPIAMLLLGAFLADVNMGSIFKNKHLYIVSFLRLLVIPLLGCLILNLFHLDETVYIAVLIPAACPIATIIAIFAQRYNKDRGLASQFVAINTILSIVTLPLVVYLSSFLR